MKKYEYDFFEDSWKSGKGEDQFNLRNFTNETRVREFEENRDELNFTPEVIKKLYRKE